VTGVQTCALPISLRPGDGLVFAIAGRVHAVRVEALGVRRGPPAEARALYSDLDAPPP
jgi:ribosome-associated heat shock protein Hsp15